MFDKLVVSHRNGLKAPHKSGQPSVRQGFPHFIQMEQKGNEVEKGGTAQEEGGILKTEDVAQSSEELRRDEHRLPIGREAGGKPRRGLYDVGEGEETAGGKAVGRGTQKEQQEQQGIESVLQG